MLSMKVILKSTQLLLMFEQNMHHENQDMRQKENTAHLYENRWRLLARRGRTGTALLYSVKTREAYYPFVIPGKIAEKGLCI